MEAAIDEIADGGGAAVPDPTLAAAAAEVEQLLRAIPPAPDGDARLEAPDRALALVQLDSRRQLVTRQLALEAWLHDWRAAETSSV